MKECNGRGFTESFKRHVVIEVERGEITQCEAGRKYGILGHSTILKWCRKYGAYSHSGSNRQSRSVMTDDKRELLFLRNENKLLKQQLKESQFREVVLETLVEVAEEELQVPIRKKFGAKRSVK